MVLPLDPAGGTSSAHQFRETAAADVDVQISPDGNWIAFVSSESGRGEVYVQPFPGPGAKTQISSGGADRARAGRRTGRELFFWSAPGGNADLFTAAIQLSPFSAAPPQKLFSAFSGTTWGVAPDGQHFLVEIRPERCHDCHRHQLVR